MTKIEFIKDSGDGMTQWMIEADGNHIGDIIRECDDFASATSRARGTKVAGYTLTIEGSESIWFPANGNARAAFKAAKAFAIAQIGGAS